MSKDLYSDRLLQWAGQDDDAGFLENPDREATRSNPLCGDRVTIQLKMDGDRIKDLRYQVRGCILCRASCAHMAGLVRGLDEPGLSALKNQFEGLLQSQTDAATISGHHDVFIPLRPHKSRHHCALLPYDTAIKALCR